MVVTRDNSLHGSLSRGGVQSATNLKFGGGGFSFETFQVPLKPKSDPLESERQKIQKITSSFQIFFSSLFMIKMMRISLLTVIVSLTVNLCIVQALSPIVWRYQPQDRSSRLFYTENSDPHGSLPHYLQHIPQPPKYAPSMNILDAAIHASNEEMLIHQHDLDHSNYHHMQTPQPQQQGRHEHYEREWRESDLGMFILYDNSLTKSEREIKAYMDYMMRSSSS